MSLDISLYIKANEQVSQQEEKEERKIYIREDGSTKQITREEWDKRFPGREPVTVCTETEDGKQEVFQEVFSANITHNLAEMAGKAKIYKHLWRPEELEIKFACELIAPLWEGLQRLKDSPEEFKKFNPTNGWGTYEGLISFVERYWEACIRYSDALIDVSR